MRDYEARAHELQSAGGRLVVLTADSEPALRQAISERGFSSTFVMVDPEFWRGWGLFNESSESLPHPTTMIVAPDGTLVYRETHTNYTRRASVERVIQWVESTGCEAPAEDLLAEIPAGVPADLFAEPEPEPTEQPAEPDWEHAYSFEVSRQATRLLIEISVAPGFHLYGAREEISRPLVATIDQLPELQIPIPAGERKVLSEHLGAAWVLEGELTLQAPLPADAPSPLSGQLEVQVCTDTTCTAPSSVGWSTE